MSLKKVFIATGIAFAAAAAQSADVSIYGIVDMGLLIRNTASIEGAAGTLAESKTSVGVESGQYYPNTFGLTRITSFISVGSNSKGIIILPPY